MGIDSFKTEPTRTAEEDKFEQEGICPGCEEEGKHLRGNEWKCTTDMSECDILTWIHTDYEIDNAKMY